MSKDTDDIATPDYWSERYAEGQTSWDLKAPNEGLLHELTQRIDTSARILIPGAGYGHEALWLWQHGYTHTYVCDWAEAPLRHLRKNPLLPNDDRLIVQDFFSLTEQYDVMLEQTFFCALPPAYRPDYVLQSAALLGDGGWLIGVLFNRKFPHNPPYGGSHAEYQSLFQEAYLIHRMEGFHASVNPRADTELLVVLRKK